jgi:hypothetical protein
LLKREGTEYLPVYCFWGVLCQKNYKYFHSILQMRKLSAHPQEGETINYFSCHRWVMVRARIQTQMCLTSAAMWAFHNWHCHSRYRYWCISNGIPAFCYQSVAQFWTISKLSDYKTSYASQLYCYLLRKGVSENSFSRYCHALCHVDLQPCYANWTRYSQMCFPKFKVHMYSWVWLCMPVIPALRKLR